MKHLLLFLLLPLALSAAELPVPVSLPLSQAVRQARELRRTGAADSVTLVLAAGTHYVDEPVVLRPEDSHMAIVGGGKATISGGVRITGWRRQGRVWAAHVPDVHGRPLEFRQLWVNGTKADRARDVANYDDMHRVLSWDKQTGDIAVPAAAVRRILHAPHAEMVIHEMWCVSVLRIRGIRLAGDSAVVSFHSPENRLHADRPWPQPMITPGGVHNSAFYLTGARELLDTEGEWHLDTDTHTLYYYPRAGEDMRTAEVIAPAVETLLQVQGTAERSVRNITVSGITFSHTTWLRPSLIGHVPLQAGFPCTEAYKLRPQTVRTDGNHKLDNQCWLTRPAAAASVSHGTDIDFRRCHFTHLASTGLDYRTACLRGNTADCRFTDIGGNAYMAGAFSDDGTEAHLTLDPLDTRTICRGGRLVNCEIRDAGLDDWGACGVAVGVVQGYNIEHNNISEVPYTGISLGWTWNAVVAAARGNRVHANHIWHYARHMYDTAGIYTLGAQPATVVSENCVEQIYSPPYAHDPEHWFYLYTDEGSAYLTVRDNWTPAEKFLQNANGPCCLWQHNGPTVPDSIRAATGLCRTRQ